MPVDVARVLVAAEAVKWTDVGTFCVAVAALVVAGFAAWANLRTNQHQATQLRRLEDEARERRRGDERSHADGVAAWLTNKPSVHVVNGNDQPVYDVEISVPSHGEVKRIHVLAPSAIHQVDLSRYNSRLRHDALSRFAAEHGADARDDHERWAEFIRAWIADGVEVRFRDVSGASWHRDGRGRLTRIDGDATA